MAFSLARMAVEILSILTVIGDILLILCLPLFFFRKSLKNAWNFLGKNTLLCSLIIALVATSGSLYFSEVAGYAPCKLCWFQRIMMYPLVILLGVALATKSKDYGKYIIPLAIIGSLISAYHYWTQRFGGMPICSAAESCSSYPFLTFSYITIPMMALTAFMLIILLNSFKPIKS